jgi:hypothetical protein
VGRTKYLLFGVNPSKNITLLTFTNLEDLLAHLKAMMDDEQKRLEGASLLLEVGCPLAFVVCAEDDSMLSCAASFFWAWGQIVVPS